MKYIFLLYDNEQSPTSLDQALQDAELQEYFAITAEMRAQGVYVGGEALHPTATATTVRLRDDKTATTDGPFAETKEQLGGYYILECKDLDEATQWALKIPAVRHGSVEIRPLVSFG
jgi:hypothetical protein